MGKVIMNKLALQNGRGLAGTRPAVASVPISNLQVHADLPPAYLPSREQAGMAVSCRSGEFAQRSGQFGHSIDLRSYPLQ